VMHRIENSPEKRGKEKGSRVPSFKKVLKGIQSIRKLKKKKTSSRGVLRVSNYPKGAVSQRPADAWSRRVVLWTYPNRKVAARSPTTKVTVPGGN